MHTGSSGQRGFRVRADANAERNRRDRGSGALTAPVQKQQHLLRQDLDVLLPQLLHDDVAAGRWVKGGNVAIRKTRVSNRNDFIHSAEQHRRIGINVLRHQF